MNIFVKHICYITALLLNSLAVSFAADIQQLSQNKTWQALLHYHDNKSLIKDNSFFLSPIGMSSPYDELKETLSVLNDPKQADWFNCKFPARTLFLEQHGLTTSKNKKCDPFDEYIQNIAIDDISLVFATEKTSSPTSMMGHLFLKLNGKKKDYTPQHSISFFADMQNISNLPQFMIKALATGTNGLYVLEPYKNKADFYVKKETRQLIEYPLNLSEDQLKFLTYHIWEMKGISVEYNLYSQNCASALITLISVINPDYKKLAYKPYLTPSDLINKMIEAKILEKETSYTIKKTPSFSINTSLGKDTRGDFLQLKVQPAYNQLMSNNHSFGYEANVDLFGLDLKIYQHENNFYINEFNIMRAQSYRSDNILSKSINFGFESENFTKSNSLFPQLQFGIGKGAKFSFLQPYFFLHSNLAYFNNNMTASVIPETGTFIYYKNYGKTHISLQKFYNSSDFKYDSRLKISQSLFVSENKNIHINYLKDGGLDTENEAFSLGIGFHF